MFSIEDLKDILEVINMYNVELISESFIRNVNVVQNEKNAKAIMKIEIALPKEKTHESEINLKTSIKVSRLVKNTDTIEDVIHSDLEVSFISYFNNLDTSIMDLLFDESIDQEIKSEIGNNLTNKTYPVIRDHIQYVFKKANINVTLPESVMR